MRKILSIIAVGIFLVGLSACGSRRDKCPTVGEVEKPSQEIIG